MREFFKRTIIKNMIFAAVLIVCILYPAQIFGFIGKLWQIIFPLILGGVFAYILSLISFKLERLYFPTSNKKFVIKSRPVVCLLASIVLICMIFIFIMNLVVPELVKAFTMIAKAVPAWIESVEAYITDEQGQFPMIISFIEDLKIDWEGLSKDMMTNVTQGASDLFTSVFSILGDVFNGVVNVVIGLTFSIYILLSKEKLSRQMNRFLRVFVKEEMVKKVGKVLSVANESFSSFIIGQCTEAVILGTLCALGMFLFQMPYAGTIGVFVGTTALIPVLGAYLGAVVGAFLIFTVDPLKALLFILFIIVLQQVEGNLIYPKVVGTSIGLPGMWVLAAVIIGGGLNGILGMMIGVPIAATVYKLLQNRVREKLD